MTIELLSFTAVKLVWDTLPATIVLPRMQACLQHWNNQLPDDLRVLPDFDPLLCFAYTPPRLALLHAYKDMCHMQPGLRLPAVDPPHIHVLTVTRDKTYRILEHTPTQCLDLGTVSVDASGLALDSSGMRWDTAWQVPVSGSMLLSEELRNRYNDYRNRLLPSSVLDIVRQWFVYHKLCRLCPLTGHYLVLHPHESLVSDLCEIMRDQRIPFRIARLHCNHDALRSGLAEARQTPAQVLTAMVAQHRDCVGIHHDFLHETIVDVHVRASVYAAEADNLTQLATKLEQLQAVVARAEQHKTLSVVFQ